MKIKYTLEAITQLDQLTNFLKLQGTPEDKIGEILDAIFTAVDSLRNMEYRAQLEHLLEHRSRGYRRLICGYRKIIYYIQNDCIVIAEIDSRQDPKKMKG